MRFLIRLKEPRVPPARLLESVKAVGITLGADPRNPKWTSYGALELDVFTATATEFDLFMSAIRPLAAVEFARDLNIAPPHMENAELYAEARRLFNAERYWEAHEVLEGVWRTKTGDEKSVLQGLILVCAALVHHQKGKDEIAVGVLRRAAPQLRYQANEFAGIDLVDLRKKVESAIQSREFEGFRV